MNAFIRVIPVDFDRCRAYFAEPLPAFRWCYGLWLAQKCTPPNRAPSTSHCPARRMDVTPWTCQLSPRKHIDLHILSRRLIDPCRQLSSTNGTLSAAAVNDSIYQASFQWYPVMGTLIVWIVALAISHTVAPNRQRVDAKLMSPLIRWYCEADGGQHVEMSTIRVTKVNEVSSGGQARGEMDESMYAVK